MFSPQEDGYSRPFRRGDDDFGGRGGGRGRGRGGYGGRGGGNHYREGGPPHAAYRGEGAPPHRERDPYARDYYRGAPPSSEEYGAISAGALSPQEAEERQLKRRERERSPVRCSEMEMFVWLTLLTCGGRSVSLRGAVWARGVLRGRRTAVARRPRARRAEPLPRGSPPPRGATAVSRRARRRVLGRPLR